MNDAERRTYLIRDLLEQAGKPTTDRNVEHMRRFFDRPSARDYLNSLPDQEAKPDADRSAS
jgi:hypothetical protein